MKRILFVFFLLLICCFSPFNYHILSLNPDTIITNNNVVNYQDKIHQLNDEIGNDGLNYLFKKEEIIIIFDVVLYLLYNTNVG